MYELVKSVRKTLMVPVKPALLTSTDENTEYIFEGRESDDEKDSFTLVSRTSLSSRGSNSLYTLNEGQDMKGMRVKCTHTFNAIGGHAPLFVTVSGLSDDEMPIDSDMILLKVPGLCVGGGVGSNDDVGYVVFLKGKTGGAEMQRFAYYHEHILIPMIQHESGMTLPVELFAASYCDGDMSQIKAVTSDPQPFIDNKIYANKQNPARTAVEQAADKAKVFPILKALKKKHTVYNVDPSNHPLKKKIHNAFVRGELAVLNLSDNKVKALVDFLSTLPDIMAKAATSTNIKFGFLENGMIDEHKHMYPVLDKILATSKRSIPTDVYNKFIEHFPYLYNIMLRQGTVPENVYTELGFFPKDCDANGKEVSRDADIGREYMQRAKSLLHPYQINEREQRFQNIQREEKRKQDKKDERVTN
jgi:hypothetical protein